MSQTPLADPWYLLASGRRHFDENMATDEAMLEAMPRLQRPILRFYGWIEPAASFGYFQKFNEVAELTKLRPLVRRPSAGGIVPHDADWTYSLAFPDSHPWYGLTACQSYERVHAWVQAAFFRLQVPVSLAPEPRKTAPGQCFQGYETADVLWFGRKIAGAAQRRTRSGLLIQGSVQPPPVPVQRGDWEQAMLAAGEEREGARFEPFEPDDLFLELAERFRSEKYARDAFNRKR